MGCGCRDTPQGTQAGEPIPYVPPSEHGGKWVVSAEGHSDLTYNSLASAREAAEATGGRISGG